MTFQLEICANSIRSALAAFEGGATRIELCDNMAEGGTTPSAGTIVQCKLLLPIPVFPIIRPRGGDFLYTDEEFEVMKKDILFCKQSGCEGIVLGILKEDWSIDTSRCKELIDLARPMEVTFHRAFDRCYDQLRGLEEIIKLGCERVLTSGGELSADLGVPRLSRLVELAAGRISIMVGSGVTEINIAELAGRTGAVEFHSTAKAAMVSEMTSSRAKGALSELDNKLPVMATSAASVRRMKRALAAYFEA